MQCDSTQVILLDLKLEACYLKKSANQKKIIERASRLLKRDITIENKQINIKVCLLKLDPNDFTGHQAFSKSHKIEYKTTV